MVQESWLIEQSSQLGHQLVRSNQGRRRLHTTSTVSANTLPRVFKDQQKDKNYQTLQGCQLHLGLPPMRELVRSKSCNSPMAARGRRSLPSTSTWWILPSSVSSRSTSLPMSPTGRNMNPFPHRMSAQSSMPSI